MVNSLFLATVIRIGLVIISYGSKVPAGIFVPSMDVGASFGRMVGIMVKAVNRYFHYFLSLILKYSNFLTFPPLSFSSFFVSYTIGIPSM